MINDDLIDDDDDLSPRLRALLDVGAVGPSMPAGVDDRLLARVLVSVGVAAVGATAATAATTTTTAATAAASTTTAVAASTAASTATGLGTSLLFKLVLGAGVVATSTVGIVTVVSNRATNHSGMHASSPVLPAARASTAAPSTATTASLMTAAATTAAAIDVPVSAPVIVTSTKPAAVTTKRSATATTTTTTTTTATATTATTATTASAVDELAQLEIARAALAAGRSDEAVSIVVALQAAVPSSPIGEERQALLVFALVQSARRGEAHAAAETFFARYPMSIFAPRVRAALAR